MSTDEQLTSDLGRLQRLLGRSELRWLVDRVRSRMERDLPLTGQVSLTDPTSDQRRAVETLLGRAPGSGRSLTVSLDQIDAVLRRSGLDGDGLAGAVVALRGPVIIRRDALAAEEAAWREALEPLAEVVTRRPELKPWYDRVSAQGLVRRLCPTAEAATPVAAAAARLLAMLPLPGVPLGQVAATVNDDAHGLDPGRPLATVVLSAIRDTWSGAEASGVTPTQRRRALWDCVGVVTDELSSTVLVLNLRTSTTGGLSRMLTLAADDGEPMVLTLRQLMRHELLFDGRQAYGCENPSVVLAAADALGARCPPLICVEGQPASAALRLLEQIASSRYPLAYHGDFDWGGLRIANLLWARFPMRPWRFDRRSYEAAATVGGRPLTGQPVVATWDEPLSNAMRRRGVRVEEEAVMTTLVEDLARDAVS